MRNIILSSLAGAGLLILSFNATAQDRDRYHDEDSYHHDRDAHFRGEHWRGHLFERVREDLDHVQTGWTRFGDTYRIERTKQELNELQGKLADGVYDQHEVDDVIGTLARVVRDNHLSPHDRDMLSDDLARVREYREHHEGWPR
jgi:hypothetical protein